MTLTIEEETTMNTHRRDLHLNGDGAWQPYEVLTANDRENSAFGMSVDKVASVALLHKLGFHTAPSDLPDVARFATTPTPRRQDATN